jgi:hypothetical protein
MERDSKGRYIKGHAPSGNGKGGRPTGLAERCRAAVADGDDLVQFYVDVFRGLIDAEIPREDGTIDQIKIPAKLEQRMEAAAWLADRGWGRAVQQIEANINPIAKVYEGLDIDSV